MKTILLLILSFTMLTSSAQGWQPLYREAMAAYKAKDYALFYEKMQAAHLMHPYHQGLLYQLGTAAALTGREREANQYLKKAILINADYKLEGVEDLSSIRDSPGFIDLLEIQKEWQRPVVHSDTAFILRDRTLHTEGIEFDAVHHTFYLGSIHKRKVIKVAADGTVSDFCPPAFQGMTSIFGIKADVKRNILWVCSSPMQEMEDYDSTARSAVFEFELTSGKFIRKYQLPPDAKDGVYGDLILSKSGAVFVSDSQNNNILKVNEKTRELEAFFTSSEFWNIQGMAFSPDEQFMFVADYIKGVFRLNMKTKELVDVMTAADVSLKGIDGLYFYKNSLIAIQNGVNPLRSMQYSLNLQLDQITSISIIDRKHPAFGEPTLGVLDGNTLYYIANSQWGGYDDQHLMKPNDQLQDIVILKAQLK